MISVIKEEPFESPLKDFTTENTLSSPMAIPLPAGSLEVPTCNAHPLMREAGVTNTLQVLLIGARLLGDYTYCCSIWLRTSYIYVTRGR